MKYDIIDYVGFSILLALLAGVILLLTLDAIVVNTEYNNICNQQGPGYVINKKFTTEDHWTHVEEHYNVTICTKDNTYGTKNVTEDEYSSVQEGDIIKWNI